MPWVDWLSGIAERFGVPTAILAVFLFFAWRIGNWIAQRADKAFDAHLDFVQKTGAALAVQTANERRQTEVLGAINEKLDGLPEPVSEAVVKKLRNAGYVGPGK